MQTSSFEKDCDDLVANVEANWAFPGAVSGKITWLANARDIRDVGLIPG